MIKRVKCANCGAILQVETDPPKPSVIEDAEAAQAAGRRELLALAERLKDPRNFGPADGYDNLTAIAWQETDPKRKLAEEKRKHGWV